MNVDIDKVIRNRMDMWKCFDRNKIIDKIKKEVAKEVYNIEQRKFIKRTAFIAEQKRLEKLEKQQEEMDEKALATKAPQ